LVRLRLEKAAKLTELSGTAVRSDGGGVDDARAAFQMRKRILCDRKVLDNVALESASDIVEIDLLKVLAYAGNESVI
jgi:hypothetical protein